MSVTHASALILAAGGSRRMNRPKFSLAFKEKTTFLEHLSMIYHDSGCSPLVAVLSSQGLAEMSHLKLDLPSALRVVVNAHPERGRFSSVLAGLSYIDADKPVFIQNIDNPFTEPDILKQLALALPHFDYTCPVFEGKRGHPLLISGKVVRDILAEKPADVPLNLFLKKYTGCMVETLSSRVLANINSELDYRAWFGRKSY